MLQPGDRLWNGAIVSASFADNYNRLQQRIQSFRDAGLPVPEQLLNGSHAMINNAR